MPGKENLVKYLFPWLKPEDHPSVDPTEELIVKALVEASGNEEQSLSAWLRDKIGKSARQTFDRLKPYDNEKAVTIFPGLGEGGKEPVWESGGAAARATAQPKRDFADKIVDALTSQDETDTDTVEQESGWSDWVEPEAPEAQIIQSILDANQGDFSAGFGEDWEGGTGGSFSQMEETDEIIARREEMLDWLAMQPGRDAASILSDPAMARHYANPAAVAQVLTKQAESNMIERHRDNAIKMMEAAVGQNGKMTPTSAAMIAQSTGVEVPKGMIGFDWPDVEDHIAQTSNELQNDIMRTFIVPNILNPGAKGIPKDVQLARRKGLRKANEVIEKYRSIAATRGMDPTDIITRMNSELAAISAESNLELSIMNPQEPAWPGLNPMVNKAADRDELVFEKIGS